MPVTHTAIIHVILSGRSVREYVETASLNEVWKRIGTHLVGSSNGGLKVGRRAIVLGPDLWSASGVCLEAGFEVIPAQNEDYRAAVEILHGASHRQFDQIVFSLKDDPLPILQRLPCDILKTWLHACDDSPVEEIRSWCDAVIDITPHENLAPKTEPAELSPTRSTPDSSTPDSSITDSSTTGNSTTGQTHEDVDFGCPQRTEPIRDRMEEIFAEQGYKIDLNRMASILRKAFPDLPAHGTDFRDAILPKLPEHIRHVPGDNGGNLIHKNHPSFEPVPVNEAVELLTLGESPKETDDVSDLPRRAAIEDIPDQAELLAAYFRWIAERPTLIENGTIEETEASFKDEEFKQRGKETGVFLWPLRNEIPVQSAHPFAECYETLARSFSLLTEIMRVEKPSVQNGFLEKTAQLAAIVLCALKTLLLNHDLTPTTCRVQKEAYGLLREFASKHQIWLENMRGTSRVDHDRLSETAEELTRLRTEFCGAKAQTRSKQELFNKCRYHLTKIRNDSDSPHDWEVIITSITELVLEHRVPESSLEFRELLEEDMDKIDRIPEEIDISPEFGRVIQNIELYREQNANPSIEDEPEKPATNVISPQIAAVRERFRDSRVVFVGGTPAAHLQHRIQEAFHIELAWPDARHSDSLNQHFKGYLEDAQTRLFLVYIPWCSHAHSRELGQLVRQAGKEFVRLKSGTNPNRIARAICDQLGLDASE